MFLISPCLLLTLESLLKSIRYFGACVFLEYVLLLWKLKVFIASHNSSGASSSETSIRGLNLFWTSTLKLLGIFNNRILQVAFLSLSFSFSVSL